MKQVFSRIQQKYNLKQLTIIILVAVFVRVWGINSPLQGDEYSSLVEAGRVVTKVNGWLYYVILHFWMKLGNADWWYRIPSILIGIVAVPISYWFGMQISNCKTKVALVFAIFTALSPFAVDLSLRVRHYSLFLTASLFTYSVAIVFIQNSAPKLLQQGLFWVGLLILITSHIFGVLMAVMILAFVYIIREGWPQKQISRIIIIGAAFAVGVFLLAWPTSRHLGWTWFQKSISAMSRVEYQAPRGISIAQVMKLPLTMYVFAVGYDVYPLTWWIVIPAITGIGLALITGFIKLWEEEQIIFFFCLSAFSLLLIVYLGFDALVPAYTETAAPRHVAMVWPAFALVGVVGASHLWKGKLTWLIIGISVIGLFYQHYGEWSYGLSGPDWRKAASIAEEGLWDSTVIVHDGRSTKPINFYFSNQLQKDYFWDYSDLEIRNLPVNVDRIIYVTNNFKTENRHNASRVLNLFQDEFVLQDGFVDYPFFEYVLERSTGDGTTLSKAGQIYQPLEIYGLEFQDLNLPIELNFHDIPFHIIGSFELSPTQSNKIFSLQRNRETRSIVLLSNVVELAKLNSGDIIAEMVLEDSMGNIQTIQLRLGYETQTWDSECSMSQPCETVYQWKKRLALVGQRKYPDAWREFKAGLHGVEINLPSPMPIKQIEFDYKAEDGKMYVWGIALEGK